MAVIRNTASALANGRIGNTTYYVANGQQIARQAQNNSNYGESASRSESQQSRRVRWSNLVNGYKAMKSWMPKAFETKSRTQSDYNKFMQLNINSSTVALTKDMAVNGCCVWESWQVSQGSLTPIRLLPESVGIGALSDIAISAAISASTTIAGLSQDIIDNNPTFKDGDNIAIIFFVNSLDDRGYPYASSVYQEFTLDTTNTALFSTLEVSSYITSSITTGFGSGYHLATIQPSSVGSGEIGFAWIHTRKVNGNLQVSSQNIYIQTSIYVDQFSSDNAVQAAIESYGVDVEVPLDPSFLKASFVRATANGADILGGIGRTYEVTGQQTLVITGRHMTDENVQLYFGETLYTPLSVDGNSWTYILGDNGTYRVYVNGNFYFGLTISGVVVPEGLPARMSMYLESSDTLSPSDATSAYKLDESSVNCLNFPHKAIEGYSFFTLSIYIADMDLSAFDKVNCSFVNSQQKTNRLVLVSTIDDATKPAYITYQGFIVAVFNY